MANVPSVIDVVCVCAYLLSASLVFRQANIAAKCGLEKKQRVMLIIALGLLVLCGSYQLDFIPRLIGRGKGFAKNSGLYAYRWPMVALTLQVIAVILTVALIRFRSQLRRLRLGEVFVLIGSIVFGGYYLLRATSLHWVEPRFGVHFGCVRTNVWFEMVAAVSIATGCCWPRKQTN